MKLVIDLDGTITNGYTADYAQASPNLGVIEKIRSYKQLGFTITIFTARNMKTYQGELGKINIHTLPLIMEWLNKYEVPYDEILVGKPWCEDGFYIDDRAIRPSEFVSMTHEEIHQLLEKEKQCYY